MRTSRPASSSTTSSLAAATRPPYRQLGRVGDAEGVGAEDLRRAVLVEDVDLGDHEASLGQPLDDGTGEVAAAEQALLDRLKAVLPPADVLVGREAVLQEVQPAAGLEH